MGVHRFVYLLPGLMLYYFSPYKEHLMTLALCILIPAIRFSEKYSSRKVMIILVMVLVASFAVTSKYRSAIWANSYTASDKPIWANISNRFHGFDAMVLTVYAVPKIFPFSQSDVLMDLTRRIVPRFLLPGKENVHRGREFSTTIWALLETGRTVNRASSPIAPSMSGDLFALHGVLSLILGAIFYGGLVGSLEHLFKQFAPIGSCVLLALFSVRISAGLERDFLFAVSNIVQFLIVTGFVAALYPFRIERDRVPGGV
jgi:hypothetical protein